MEYMEIRSAYNDVKYGRKTLDEVLEMLKEMPDKKEVFQNDETLLHLAAANLHLDAVAYLLDQGCDPNAQNESGHTPLWIVALYRDTPVVTENTVYDVTTKSWKVELH